MPELPADPPQSRKRAGKGPLSREDRLKAALKANMARRKAQAKARAQSPALEDAAQEAETFGAAGEAGADNMIKDE